MPQGPPSSSAAGSRFSISPAPPFTGLTRMTAPPSPPRARSKPSSRGSHVWGAVLNAGLEPFAGFLHVDRPGKPSLVLDLVEEFRQPVVDRVVLSHVNLGSAIRIENGMLELRRGALWRNESSSG
ncbi:MAG: CRISPR-associated endonuclease Cas1 [Acidobacteria bacterium]|nr:CRISPR-associated endonuclease Cas1 [Acidobacteriota bacterium]